jgi:hypothetical protein
MPPSNPPPVLIVPTAGLLLLHVPPAGEPVSDWVEPSQTWITAGDMPVGNGLMSIVCVREHPAIVYERTLVPANAPQTFPVPAVTVTLPLLALHAPPAGVLVSVVQLPTQRLVAPVITPGSAFTVTVVLRAQPVGNVYTMV